LKFVRAAAAADIPKTTLKESQVIPFFNWNKIKNNASPKSLNFGFSVTEVSMYSSYVCPYFSK
jgi:hypothetical protein